MVYDESLEKAIMERHDRENLLDSVDIDGNFATYYQAKTDVNTEQIVGAEALVRFWIPQPRELSGLPASLCLTMRRPER